MAVTKAKDENKPVTVAQGASGGFAPEGYGAVGLVTQPKIETVVTDEKKFAEAQKFMDSKKQAAEQVNKAEAQLDKGEVPEQSVVSKQAEHQKKVQEKEAAKKPTVAGAQADQLDNPAAVQSAKETEKQEVKEVVAAAEANKPNAQQAKDK